MYPLSLQELGSDNTAYVFRSIYNLIILNLLWSIVKRSKELSKLHASGTFTYYFISIKENNFFSLVPRYYGLSLLRTLYFPPVGVRNNGSRLY